MRAIAKTLFGDVRNILGVGAIIGVAAACVGTGHSDWAVVATPAVVLAVVACLARS
jgi:hypothetical protein